LCAIRISFFSSCAQFVPQMVNSLNRIGLSPNCSVENRRLAVDLANLIISWELQRCTSTTAAIVSFRPEGTSGEQCASGSKLQKLPQDAAMLTEELGVVASTTAHAAAGMTVRSEDEFKASAAIVEVLVNFLIRVALVAGDSKDAQGLGDQCVILLDQALGVWPDANIKFQYFDKQLSAASDSCSSFLVGLAILGSILRKQPRFLLRNLKQLQQLLRPAFENHTDNIKLVSALCIFLREVLAGLGALAEASGNISHSELAHFMRWLSETIGTGLQVTKELQVIHGCVQLLQTLSLHRPGLLDQHLPALAMLLQRLSKEHVIRRTDPSALGTDRTDCNADQAVRTLTVVIQLMSGRLIEMGERRDLFFTSLLFLMERSTDVHLLVHITKVVRPWLSAPMGAQPCLSLTERATFVLKMVGFEFVHSAELHRAFLRTVLSLYNDPDLERSELLKKIEPAFVVGLRAGDASVRAEFFAILHRSVGRSAVHRLSFVINNNDGDSLSAKLSLRQATRLLLAAASPTSTVATSSTAPQLPNLCFTTAHVHTASGSSTDEENWQTVLQQQRNFLFYCAGAKCGDLVAPLVELLHVPPVAVDKVTSDAVSLSAAANGTWNDGLVVELWTSAFAQLWTQLTTPQQDNFVKPLMSLLSKEPRGKQLYSPTLNVVHGWLHALSRCQPMPKLPAALLGYLAKTHAAWHLVLPMLQDHILVYPSEAQWYEALTQLFEILGDRDGFCALWSRRACHSETRLALALEQYGSWAAAQTAYVDCMTHWQAGDALFVNTPPTELQLWEDGVIRCAKHLNQWELLSEYAKATEQPALLMECAWKMSEWERLTDLFCKYSLPDEPGIRMLQTYAAIHDGKLSEAEARCNDGIQLALQLWCLLPSVECTAHTPLLQMFQQFQELQESAQMLMELNSAQRAGTVPPHCLTLRARFPLSA
jgi:transformation/transcription domain-associated protein